MRALALILLASPAAGAGLFQLPAGCEGLVSIQAVDCTVTHLYRCEGDAQGDTHRIDLGEDGAIFYTRTDREARWMHSIDLHNGREERLGEARDPASMDELLAQGADSWDFDMQEVGGGIERFVGYDQLTGKAVEIDGVQLLRTAFDMTAYDGSGQQTWASRGNEYVMPDWRVFIGGTSTVTPPEGDEYDRDGSPMRFDFPGDDGFLTTQPLFGCSVNLARFVRPPPRTHQAGG